jgi:hypothetical protein
LPRAATILEARFRYPAGLLLFWNIAGSEERKYPMKKIALALALVLAGSSLAVGLASTDANAGARKICKQMLMRHPMAGEHNDLMKRCKAEYKAYKKAHGART